jgi:fimbrial isopeptide formation D2 family protein/LPXTG-motif cell wall-anchored protein
VSIAETSTGSKTYTGTVVGDGYYLVIDSTSGSLSIEDEDDDDYMGSDTLSKNILIPVLNNVSANAKDTHIKPDKEILKANGASFDRVKEGSAAIGDEVTFEVSIPVPNTAKYQKGFTFEMNDTLPAGMTFKELVSVKVGEDDVPYTLTVKEADGTTAFAPASGADLVTTTGGQKIHIDFKDASHDFKYYSEAGEWYGSNLVVTYTAVVNKDANLTPTGNLNEVTFTYANDPNHAYDGTEDNPPTGTTPEDKTKTVLANIDIYKTDGTSALSGAEFEITSTDYNVTLVTGEKFEASTAASPYEAQTGETIETGTTYYKLADGTFTTTAYTTDNAGYYEDDTTYVKVLFTKKVTTPGTTNKVTVISGADGHIKLEGVKPGTYTIKETKAPLGFNLDPDEHVIEITDSYSTTTKTITLDCTSTGVTWDGDTATASIEIVNNSGTTLPSTGGVGTTIFYVTGLLLVLGAGTILVARRKADAE